MSVENLIARQDHESLEDFRKRIRTTALAKKPNTKLPKTPDRRPVDAWWETIGQEGLLAGMYGWEKMQESIVLETTSSAPSYGSDMMTEVEGAGSFIGALNKTIGKGITMDDVMDKISREIRTIEVRFGEFPLKGNFLNWCVDQMQEARNLNKKADELRQAS